MSRPALSPAETEVIRMIAVGMTDKQIAFARNRGVDTVKSTLKTARIKLDARNRAHAVALAIRTGMI